MEENKLKVLKMGMNPEGVPVYKIKELFPETTAQTIITLIDSKMIVKRDKFSFRTTETGKGVVLASLEE